MTPKVCGIDFGTSNSTIGINDGKQGHLLSFADGSLSIPTVLLWQRHTNDFLVGQQAVKEFTDGEEGRFFRSLKRYLGEEDEISTLIGVRAATATRYFLTDLISVILKGMKTHAEAKENCELDTVLLGRPVKYNDEEGDLDSQAQNRMVKAANQAGFKHVDFLYEPVAAALTYERTLDREENVLIGDIGGGTSDFSVVRVGPSHQNKVDRRDDILGNAGVYVGGDSFDSKVMYEHVTPHLGRGSQFHTGNKMMEVPVSLYSTVSQWHLIHFLKDLKTLENLKSFITFGNAPTEVNRLREIIEHDLGFDLFKVVERFKIDLTQKQDAQLNAHFFSDPFQLEKTRNDFDEACEPVLEKIEKALLEVVEQASLRFDQIDTVFLVGGSTLIPAVHQIFSKYFDERQISSQDVFTSVGYGLSLGAKKLV